MLKINIMSVFVLLTIVMLVGCGQIYNNEYIPQINDSQLIQEQLPMQSAAHVIPLTFETLEEFFYEHVAVKESRSIRGGDDSDMWINFAALEEIVLPIAILEEYEIVRVGLCVNVFDIHFNPIIPIEDIFLGYQMIGFEIWRWTYEDLESWGQESPLEGIMDQFGFTEDDFINNKFFVREDEHFISLYWAVGPKLAYLYIPRLQLDSGLRHHRELNETNSIIHNLTADTMHDLLPLTQTIAVNLSDTALIQAIVEAEQAGQMFTMEHYEQHIARQLAAH